MKLGALNQCYQKFISFISGKGKGLKESEERYRSIFDNSTIGLYRTTPDGKILLANRTLIKKLGFSSFEELSFRNLKSPGFEPSYERNQFLELIEKNGEVLGVEEVWKCRDGSSIFMRESARAVRDNHGKTLFYDGTVEDFTETRQIIEKLKESEKIFSDMFMKSPVSTMLNVPYIGTILDVNEAFIRESEYTREELIGNSFLNLNLFADIKDRQQILDMIKQFGCVTDLEVRFQNKSHTKHYGLLNIVFVKLKGIVCELVTIINITERKLTELALLESEEKYRTINEELQQTNFELIRSKEKAEESDRLKTAFLQNMSHEIRTPMNAIMGFSELLIKQYNNKPKLEKYSTIINQRCNDLLDIINDLLDIAKIESGQLTVNFEKCNLNELFQELTTYFSEHQKRIGKNNVIFSLRNFCYPNKNIIVTDKVKLKHIFINLIDNAFKFTETGTIEGGSKYDGNQRLIFYLSDTGKGIPPEKQHIIFERFAQLDPGKDQAVSGTGLGLSIVQGLINLLGGEINLESEPGVGSTFTFSIPYKTIQQEQPEPVKSDFPALTHFLDKTILIVEDDPYNAEYIKEILSNAGLAFLHTTFGQEAIEMATAQQIDLVLMDVGLPDMNGYEATRQIRLVKPHIIIIAQTAFTSHFERQRAIEAGCNDYISKPTREDLLLSMVNRHLAQCLS